MSADGERWYEMRDQHPTPLEIGDAPRLSPGASADEEMDDRTPRSPQSWGPGDTLRITSEAYVRMSLMQRVARWCREEGCTGVLSVVLLLWIIFYLSMMVALHCTPLLDVMANFKDAHEYLLLTPAIQASVGVACVLLVMKTLWSLVTITCCHRRQADLVVMRDTARSASRFWFIRKYQWVAKWVVDPDAPFFEWYEFAREVIEMALQVWALHSYSENGVPRAFLVAYVLVLSGNGLSALLYLGSCRNLLRGNARGGAEDHLSAAKRVRGIVTVDVLCDCFYGSFPLIELLVKYYYAYYDDWGATHLCLHAAKESRSCDFIQALYMQQSATLTLFGGDYFSVVILKVLTRLVPFYFASGRLVEIIELRSLAKYHKARRHLPKIRGGHSKPRSRNRPSPRNSGEEKQKEASEKPKKPMRRPVSLLEMVSGNVRRGRVPRWSISLAKQQVSRSVPRSAVLLLVLGSACLCVFALVRLATVSVGCERELWVQSCPTPSYPIFDLQLPAVESIGSAPLCPCSLVSVNGGNCTKRAHMEKLREGLWKDRTAIASYVRVIGITSCALKNTDVTEIFENLRELGSLLLQDGTMIEAPLVLPENITGVTHMGWRKNGLRKPKYMPALMGLGLPAMKITHIPSIWRKFKRLRTLSLVDNPLVEYPPVLEKLPGILGLFMSNTNISELPRWMGRNQTELRQIGMDNNRLTQLPSELGLLTKLRYLTLAQNYITTFPDEFADMRELSQMNLGGNQLSAVPACMVEKDVGGKPSGLASIWPKLRYLNLEGNLIQSLPPHWQAVVDKSSGGNMSNHPVDQDSLLVRVGANPATNNVRSWVEEFDEGSGLTTITSTVPSCTPGCNDLEWSVASVHDRTGDHVCHVQCNTSQCHYDGGDCVGRWGST